MATNNNQGARIGKSYYKPIFSSLTVQQVRLSSSDIEQWRTAINSAKNNLNPRRQKLYELYENIELDGHLLSVMGKRRMRITNKRVHFAIDGSDGAPDEAVKNSVLETPWFYDMIKYLMESKAWGHSLVELIPEKGIISKSKLVPRLNVVPEKGILAYNSMNPEQGILYREDPAYSNNLIEAGSEKDLGLMMSAAQYVIYKRGGFGDWSQFAELFGMPFREGNYQPYDDNGRKKLEEALANMGGAGWVVTPEGTSIKFHDNNGTGKSDIFENLIKQCDSQVSKIFLGNTMTTDNGSSRSQSETHQDSEDEIVQSDLIELEYLLNWSVKPKLIALGLPIPQGRFFYPEMESVPLEKRIVMDMKLSDKISISDEYWYKTYGIPKPDGNTPPVKIKTDSNKPVEKSPGNGQNRKNTDAKAVEAMNRKAKALEEMTKLHGEIVSIYRGHQHEH